MKNRILNRISDLQVTAADLGEKNMPKVIVQQIVPEIQTLYYREETANNETVEIWSQYNDRFALVVGDFSDGEWGQQDISLFNEVDDLNDALNLARTNFVLMSDEEPHEQLTANIEVPFKRLIRKG